MATNYESTKTVFYFSDVYLTSLKYVSIPNSSLGIIKRRTGLENRVENEMKNGMENTDSFF